MMLNNVQLYYFSPTGGTLACSEHFCRSISRSVTAVDLGQIGPAAAPEADVVVFAAPVFGGRIPAPAAEKIAALAVQGRPAVTMAVYGVRAYDDALLELNDAAEAAGFRVIASAAVIAQHSVVPAVGQGRPDAQDKAEITAFAETLLAKLAQADFSPVTVPGNRPYKDPMTVPATPVCLPDCGLCGKCVRVCPTGAMKLENGKIESDLSKCLMCMACVAACPQKARALPTPVQNVMDEKLMPLAPVRRENQFFL